MITYAAHTNTPHRAKLAVRLNGQMVGAIEKVRGGYWYRPTGSKFGGEVLPTIDAVKATL